MPTFALIPALTFAVVGTFSPGPNNVLSASLGMRYGYRRILGFLMGMTLGFVITMSACAFASAALLDALPWVEGWLRWIGAAYIAWLAYHSWHTRRQLGAESHDGTDQSFTFWSGTLLQFINPKVLIYGVMMYTTFLSPLASSPLWLTVSAVVLALIGLAAVSTWALGGVAISGWLTTDRDRAIVAGVLAATLAYTAVEMVLPALGL